MKKTLLLILFVCLSAIVHSQRVVNICGKTEYVVPEWQSVQEAKNTALQRARVKALADEFGVLVSQTNTNTQHLHNGKTDSDFNSFSENEVRGIWLEDTKEPEIDINYRNGEMTIKVYVCGKAREIKSSRVELRVDVLNNGFESDKFHNGDRMSVRFQSPVKGYVAIFVRDDNSDMVYVMMPYDTENADGYAREVKSNREYHFLTTQDPEYPYDEETIMTTERKIETNTLLVVFSEKRFRLSLNNKGEFVPQVPLKKFQKWIHGLRVYETLCK